MNVSRETFVLMIASLQDYKFYKVYTLRYRNPPTVHSLTNASNEIIFHSINLPLINLIHLAS